MTRQIALDGIDELLTGFLTRGKSRLRSEQAADVSRSARTTSAAPGWCTSAPSHPSSSRTATSDADLVLEGPAETLYLALWNRTDELQGEGYDFWRDTAQVSWS